MRGISVLLVLPATLVALCTAEGVEAAPTSACRNLAKQFGEKPEVLDVSELARLRTCVSDELSSKMEDRRLPVPPPPPPPPPAPAPSK